jgi:hypothetical protein
MSSLFSGTCNWKVYKSVYPFLQVVFVQRKMEIPTEKPICMLSSPNYAHSIAISKSIPLVPLPENANHWLSFDML